MATKEKHNHKDLFMLFLSLLPLFSSPALSFGWRPKLVRVSLAGRSFSVVYRNFADGLLKIQFLKKPFRALQN